MSRTYVWMPALAAASFVFAAAQAQAPYCGEDYGTGVMGSLSQEQRMMHYAEVQDAVANLSPNDMRSFRSDLRNHVKAMTPAERMHFAQDLTAKWKALAPQQRAKIQQSFTTYRNDGRWGALGMRQGKSMGGCWW
ncbi:Spy/CpxP family protein refolding chaperone [Rhizomicrobium palustre]|uniref:Spy/CpxP family protein refolding chaperone n=1 Tax=Rhizomicrobium palustre TaxID=189966 RepID=A0A846MVC4_9PROT|nr:DUF3106 domain-containing protein [Rhizomicrobium palustre]NIK87313.1 Spy/CpxP family protein refolding chaperone [Rhizomicrobium palustre]